MVKGGQAGMSCPQHGLGSAPGSHTQHGQQGGVPFWGSACFGVDVPSSRISAIERAPACRSQAFHFLLLPPLGGLGQHMLNRMTQGRQPSKGRWLGIREDCWDPPSEMGALCLVLVFLPLRVRPGANGEAGSLLGLLCQGLWLSFETGALLPRVTHSGGALASARPGPACLLQLTRSQPLPGTGAGPEWLDADCSSLCQLQDPESPCPFLCGSSSLLVVFLSCSSNEQP